MPSAPARVATAVRALVLAAALSVLSAGPASAAVSHDPNYSADLLTSGLSGPANGLVYRIPTNDLLVTEFDSGEVTSVDALSGAQAPFAAMPSPDEMAINSLGNVYVKEHNSFGPIHRFSPTGTPLGTFPAPCSGVTGIAFDALDNFYVACNDTGEIFTNAETAPTVYASGFPSLEGMDFSPTGKLFVTDWLNGRIFEVTPGGTTLADHVQWADGLNQPLNVGFDTLSGDLFASSTGRVVRIPSPGNVTTFASGFAQAFDPDFDALGCLYVDDFPAGEIWKFCPGNVEPPRVAQHFKGFRAVGGAATRERVTLIDQFGQQTVRLGAVRQLFTPVEKRRAGRDPEPIQRPEEHLKCYRITGVSAARTVRISNQFTASSELQVGQPTDLCTPASKTLEGDPGPAPTDLNHYKCYVVSGGASVAETVDLVDQFGLQRARVQRPSRLCNPVEKRRAGHDPEVPPHPTEHLVCYQLRQLGDPFSPRTVFTRDQFTTESLLIDQPGRLCVPSEKQELGGV
jgi:hypothetical protein